MFNGKMKAVTFSYDDAVLQDIRFIELLNKYGLKGTFNINSELLGHENQISDGEGNIVNHTKVRAEDVKAIYSGHEVAVHTLTHPNLTTLDEAEIIRQVEQDRIKLSDLVGYNVQGMAYPCGGVNNDERVAEIIRNNTGVKYSRTITSTFNFDLQSNLLRFNPTVYHMQFDEMFKLANEFIELKTDTPKIFYIWGHTYELDFKDTWGKMEELLKIISNRDDIFYGTNSEVLL